jgi:hypothetical protein
MRRVTTLEERQHIGALARQGYHDREIAQQLGWSVGAVRRWRRCSQRDQALQNRLGRPPTGTLGTFPAEVRAKVSEWRDAHTNWGAKTLHTELALQGVAQGAQRPSMRSLARFLHANKKTRTYERHRTLPEAPATAAQAVHEVWELDARGHEHVPEVGIETLINLNDRYSHLRLLSYPCELGQERVTRHANTEDYQVALRLAFCDWGLPDRLATDHESVFYDNLEKSPFPTRFHLWLLALGVTLTFGRLGRPTDQGMTERSHQLWQQQVLDGQTFANREALYQALKQRREVLNSSLPCASLGEVPPLQAFPEAKTPRRLYRLEWEMDLLDLTRIHAYLAQGQWFRLASNIGAVSLGQQRYCLGKVWARQQVAITFDPATQELVFTVTQPARTKRLPIKGITKDALIGELGPLVNLPVFQPMLPMSWNEFRAVHLCGTLAS